MEPDVRAWQPHALSAIHPREMSRICAQEQFLAVNVFCEVLVI
jgi:hypothetical protein